MRQKCPKCGEWCYAEERSFKEKVLQSVNNHPTTTTSVGQIVGSTLSSVMYASLGVLGGVASAVASTVAKPIIDGLSESDCHFHCNHCGYEWDANIDEDQSIEHEHELIAKISEKVQEIKDEKDYKAIESLCKQLDRYDCAEAYYWRAKAQQLIANSYWDEALISDEHWEQRSEWLERAYDIIRQDIQFYQEDVDTYVEKDGGLAYGYAYLLYAEIVRDCSRTRVSYEMNGLVVAREMFIRAMDTEFDSIKQNAISEYEDCTNVLLGLFDAYDNEKAEVADYLNSNDKDENEIAEAMIAIAEKDRFSNIPFYDRQFVFVTKAGSDSISGCVDEDDIIKYVFTIDQLPKELAFPVGHPQQNTLYVASPVKKGYYVPYCDAEETFFHEKVDDFIRLSQCLGSMEITFRSLKGQSIAESFLSSGNYNLGGSMKSNSVSGGYSQKISGNGSYDSSKSVELSRKYDPIKYPYCPDDIEWLRFDPSWQSFVKQRLEGNTLEASMRISSTETISSNVNTIKNVKAAFECMMGKVDANYDSEEDNTFSQTESTEWQISVKFRSIRDFTEQSPISPQKVSSIQLSPGEEKYKEEVLFVIEDGVIGDAERRLLERKRQKYCVSEERAKLIEESCAPSLSEEEKEYIEIYKDMLEDGEISERRRKILNKEAESLGIPHSRVKELEEMI